MRNCATPNSTRARTAGIRLLAFALISSMGGFHAAAQTTGTPADRQSATEWKPVEDALGRKGDLLPGGVIRINMPRRDLHVTVDGAEIKPSLALGAWAAFHRVGKEAMVMGDLVLTEDEVAPVMKTLQEGGVQVTALQNHLLGESPKILYVHMGGHGDPAQMAHTINAAVALT